MEPRLKELFKGVRFERDQTNRHKLKVFLICLAISVFIWFLIVLSNESSTTLDYPIIYTNTPADLILVNHPDSILSFRIASGGFELLTLKYLTRKRPLEIDLSLLSLEKRDSHFVGTYSTSQIAADITKNFNFTKELVSISPQVISFKFEPLIGKRLPILPNVELSFIPPYRLSDSLILIPDSVNVSGPDNIISKISCIETKKTKIDGIRDKVTQVLTLLNPDINQITLGLTSVKVEIRSEKYTESTISVPVTAWHSGLKVKTFPSHINITYLVSLKDFNRISPEMFVAGVNISGETADNKAVVVLEESPSFVKVTRVEPNEVEYLVIKQ
ncbi:MAG: hypothetical protein R2750_07230 [Bacteroidales bacterium]